MNDGPRVVGMGMKRGPGMRVDLNTNPATSLRELPPERVEPVTIQFESITSSVMVWVNDLVK